MTNAQVKEYVDSKLADFIANKVLPKRDTISGKELVKIINEKSDSINSFYRIKIYNMTEPKLRDLINLIRKEGICNTGEIIANSDGYSISNDKDEVIGYLQNWRERLSSQTNAIDGMNRRLDKLESKPKSKFTTIDTNKDKKDLFDSL